MFGLELDAFLFTGLVALSTLWVGIVETALVKGALLLVDELLVL